MNVTQKRQRRRMELSVKFRIRSSQKNDVAPRNLQIRLTVEGVTVGDYSSGVFVRPKLWNQKDQLVMGKGKVVEDQNARLAEIELEHRKIWNQLKFRYSRGEGPLPTAAMVKAEYTEPGTLSPTLARWYDTYLDYLDSLNGLEDGRAEKTIARAYKTKEYIRDFSGTDAKPGSPDKSAKLAELVVGCGKRFHTWLQTHPVTGKRRMQKDSANKYLAHVRDALTYAVDEGLLKVNVLDQYRPKRGKGKPVYFLEPPHLKKLAELAYDGEAADWLWWCRLMCYTGLDYRDAVRYAAARSEYEEEGPGGWKIVITRAKPPHNVCEIPLLAEVIALFEHHPTGPRKPYDRAEVSNFMKGTIGPAVGFPFAFTSKIARKTAGAHFVRIGYAIATVSKFLGHSSSRTTEDHYIRVTTSHVDAEMVRVREQAAGSSHVYERVVRLPR